ncbi:zinc finger AN1 domain-containing stress-associated protein 12 [Medicago truncatula]|uniref:Zinc finger AN1 domain stress-associated protein n=2 Tax=Medicago truncatula TaxID=3880 RepID=I3SH14_MEDTR|nr:zinc finger AN1 domain-containing stress-associated protein 12 [Medicago truncatula]AFK39556.1 unknown [Medicago truncatula]KEH24928.1 zinc finger AN1 domain stress-associated protein [Medicago truncatula]
MASGGTEAFPDLGKHCQHVDCHQLDFLPFTCDGCKQVFCVEHRSYKSHECPKPDHNSRKVVVCEECSMSMEIRGNMGENEEAILKKHRSSGKCDPSKKKKPTCPVKRCKEILTFSNTSTCKTCHIKVCLKHRFSADHACSKGDSSSLTTTAGNGRWNNRFMAALASRNGQDCGKKSGSRSTTSPPSNPSVKAC